MAMGSGPWSETGCTRPRTRPRTRAGHSAKPVRERSQRKPQLLLQTGREAERRLPDGRYMLVVLRPGPGDAWTCVSAYPVLAYSWKNATRAKAARFPP